MENVEIVNAEDMVTRRGGHKGSGEKYSKYRSAIAPHLPFLREGIAAAKDGILRLKVNDVAKAMGMIGKHETSIYWGLKYVLFAEGMVVTTGTTNTDEPVLVIREKKEGDVLPYSLARYLVKEESETTDVDKKLEE
jgi:hypothetical protein